MKVKTADLIDLSLDWAVAVADWLNPVMRHDYMRAKAAANNYKGDLAWHLEVTPNEPITVDEAGVTRVLRAYSGQWSQSGPIVDREGIYFGPLPDKGIRAYRFMDGEYLNLTDCWGENITRCVVAMRCFVASRLGDEVGGSRRTHEN